MKPSEWQQLGVALRREKALQTKWQPARGAGCARSSTASGGGRKISLDIPFYRTSHTSNASYSEADTASWRPTPAEAYRETPQCSNEGPKDQYSKACWY